MSNKLLTLTIVIPVYNDEDHLMTCLDAIAAQIIKPEAVIVVDNNSTDGSAAVARRYPFVKLIKEKKRGVVFARDTGFDAVKTDLIGRIDSDTVVPPTWVGYVKNFYQHKSHLSEALTGGCYFYNVRLPRIASWWQGQVAFRYNRLLLGHYILFGSNMAMPTQFWKKVKLKVCDDLDVHEDLDVAIHLHRLGYKITYKESLRVGVNMKRVRSNHKDLWGNIMWWPKTLRRHGRKAWVFGWLGALLFYIFSPIVPIAEWLARCFGRPSLPD